MLNKFNKTQIARSFNRAAASYNQVSFLQQEVGNKLLSGLDNLRDKSLKVVDLGCGTGVLTAKLSHIFPGREVVGIDISEDMISHASQGFSKEENLSFVCADADRLPIEDEFFDLGFSNLMLQWSPNVEVTLAEWGRVLKPGGSLFFSTLGSGSLNELSSIWSKIDNYTHASNFIAREQLLAVVKRIGFKNLQVETHNHFRFFDSVHELMQELKMLGAHNLHGERHRGLLGKNKFKRLQMFYEEYRNQNNKLPLSFEVYYVKACK